MKKIKKEMLLFLGLFSISILIFWNFVTMHYATDTYNIIDRGYKEYALLYSLNDGRPFMCLISLIANQFNVPINIYIISLTVIAIGVSCVSVMVLKNSILKIKPLESNILKVLLVVICYCTIFNFMYLENLQFAECAVMAISILCFLLSADILIQKGHLYILKSFVLLAIGELFYQGTLGFFVTIVFLFSITKEKNIKEVIKNIFISVFMCIIAVAINLLQIRISGYFLGITQVRMGSIKNILVNIPIILKALPNIIMYTVNMFPAKLFFIYTMIIISISLVYIPEEKSKYTMQKLISVVLLILVAVGCSFAINIFSLAGFNGARMLFPLGSLIGLLFLYLLADTQIFEQDKVYKIIMIGLVCIYFVILNLNIINIINDHKKVNELTKKECITIGEFLKEYEESTGKQLKYIAVCYDSIPTYYYKEVNHTNALTLRPLSVEWGDNGSINYYTGRKLKEIAMPTQVYEQYFKGKNWDELNKEQFVFIEDTMYYCIY